MILQDANLSQDAGAVRFPVKFHRTTVGASQADVKIGAFRPGFAFEIVEVQHFANTVTATVSYMVKIGTTNALAAATTPTADTRGSATLHATESNLRGDLDDEINLHVTSNGTGAFADLEVWVVIRPQACR